MNFLAGLLSGFLVVGAVCVAIVAATAEEPEAASSSCHVGFVSVTWRGSEPTIDHLFLPCGDTALALAWREV